MALSACATLKTSGEPVPAVEEQHVTSKADTRDKNGDAKVGSEPRDEALGGCEQFEQNQQNALSAKEHEAQFGCPPCPCSCVNGKIVCAPCAACESFAEPKRGVQDFTKTTR